MLCSLHEEKFLPSNSICICQFSSPINFFRANDKDFYLRLCKENIFERMAKVFVHIREKKNFCPVVAFGEDLWLPTSTIAVL